MKRNEDFMLREISGESLLVPTGNSASDFNGLITLNEMAAFIWKHIDECGTEEDVVLKVFEEYDADEDLVRKDVHELIEGFIQLGIVFR